MVSANFDLLFAIISPFFSSIATIFKAGATKSLTPLIVIGVGSAMGSAVLFLLAKILSEKVSLEKIKLNWKDFAMLILLRTLLGELFFTFGLSQTSVIKAIFFTKVEPYFVLLLGWFLLKERVYGKHLFLLTIHLFGALILSTKGNFNIVGQAQIGDLFIIIAMGFFASSYNYGKRLSKKIGSVSTNAISLGLGSLILFPLAILFSPLDKFSSSIGWTYLILYVVLFNVISLTLWFASLKSLKEWVVSALRYLGPVFGAPVAYILFKETLNLTQVAGAIIILTTSFLIARENVSSRKVTEDLTS